MHLAKIVDILRGKCTVVIRTHWARPVLVSDQSFQDVNHPKVYVYAPSPPSCRPSAGDYVQAPHDALSQKRFLRWSPVVFCCKTNIYQKHIHQTRRRQKLATQRISVDTFSYIHITKKKRSQFTQHKQISALNPSYLHHFDARDASKCTKNISHQTRRRQVTLYRNA